jgi:hypothetical protein
MRKIIGIIVFAIAICSCGGNKNDDTLLAEVNGKKLHLSDLSDFFSLNSVYDSASVVSTYTTAWVRRQLMVKKAEELLDEKQKNLTAEIEDYRSSLLIYRLEQDYISKNTDTLLESDEIKKFYEENKNLFTRQSTLVKIAYIKIQTAAPESEEIRMMCRRPPGKENMRNIEEKSLKYAEKYDLFDGEWLDMQEILRLLPPNINSNDLEKILMQAKYYETRDSRYCYFVYVLDELKKGEVSPLERESDKIRTIVANKKKQELVTKLEEETYNAGIENKDAKIYINNNK